MSDLTRRSFLKAVGLGSVAVALGRLPSPEPAAVAPTTVTESLPTVYKASAYVPVTSEFLEDADVFMDVSPLLGIGAEYVRKELRKVGVVRRGEIKFDSNDGNFYRIMDRRA